MGSRLEHVIARNVTELRAKHQATQHDLAAKMRANGFAWQTNRVAQIETLRAPVALLEVVGLAYVFGEPVARLLAGDDEIELPSGDTWPLAAVRDALSGEERSIEMRDVTPEESAAYRASGDDLVRMAGKLGLHPQDLEAFAHRVFGQSFRAEREARTGDVSGMSAHSARTKRGHVSRALLADISDYLGEGEDRAAKLEELRQAADDAADANRP